VHQETLTFKTQGNNEVIDLTDRVKSVLSQTEITTGLVTVFSSHTTTAITVLEFEPGANRDLGEVMNRLIPQSHSYHHNVMDSNGHAHARAAIIGPSVSVPLTHGVLQLGRWQHIALIDFDDRPRERNLHITIIG